MLLSPRYPKTGVMTVTASADIPWQTYRDVRLRALETDPEQYGSNFAREAAFPDEEWARRALNPGTFLWIPTNEPDASSQVAPRATGLASLVRPWTPDVAREICEHYDVRENELGLITQVWVQPSERGNGIVDALFHTMVNSAEKQGISLIVLHVMKANERAAAAYRRLGFVKADEPSEHCPSDEDEYTLRLV